MPRINHTPAPRCSVCRHPEREDLDRDLVLRRRTQAEVSRIVGVDRSTVSRHVKNHVMPALVETMLLDTTEVAMGSLVEAFDRLYKESWRRHEMALSAGDLKLAHATGVEQRKLLETVSRMGTYLKGANLTDIIGGDEEAERIHLEQVRVNLVDRLETLFGRHRDQMPRGDEHLNPGPGGKRDQYGHVIEPDTDDEGLGQP